jgi:hypothetical protein
MKHETAVVCNWKSDDIAVRKWLVQHWFCHSTCGRGGDILKLEAALTGGDFPTRKAEIFRLVGRVEPEYQHNGTRTNGNSAGTAPSKPTKPIGTAGAWPEVARYPYRDRDGNLLFEVIRYLKPDGEKVFRQCRPDGRGGVTWNLDGIERVPYRLPELLKAETVYLPEGEKDVHTLEAWELVASCNPGGSGSSALYPGWVDYFRDRQIVILPDNDGPGRKHAAAVAAALLSVAASVRIVELPGLPAKGDITDWRDAGGTFERFHELTVTAAVMDAAALSELRARWGLAGEEPHQARAEAADDWPKLEPIQSELPPVEAFSEDLLPDSFRPLVTDVTERMQVPMDYPAVVMVLCLAGAVNRRGVIQPKANDTGWVIVPNLWGGIIAPPGFMKSPVIQAATRPLNQIQTEWRHEHEEALKDHAREKEEYELRRAAWREQYKAASKKGSAAPDRPEDEPEEPKLRRLIVNDATFEALHQTMSENPAGILVIRDELTGWWSQLDRAGREGERAFCLQAWNGDTVLNREGVRIMALEGGTTIGVWSDLDGPGARAALRIFGSDRLPLRYLDGAGIPMLYKLRRVDGEPVPMNVLAEMERHPSEPWKVRDRILNEMGWCSKPLASTVRHRERRAGRQWLTG